MKNTFVLFCLVFPATVFASLNPALIRQADAYFEAKEYEAAIEHFQRLLKENPTHWQKERLLYNIGTAYLRLENFEKATEIYESIDISSSNPDPLLKSLKTNQALSAILQAEKLLNQKTINQEDVEKAVFLLKESLKEIKKAKKAGCLFDQFIGKTPCDEDSSLSTLKSKAERLLKDLLEKNPEAGSLNRLLKSYEESIKNKKELNSPEEILEAMIFFESNALKLRRMKLEMDHPDERLNRLLEQSQEQSLETARLFPGKVIEYEKELYPSGCQCEPWNQVIPLFDQGKKAAVRARSHHFVNLVLKEQEKAVKFWQEALEKLKQYKNKNPPEKKNPPPENQQSQAPHLQKLLSELQQMDQEDRKTSSKKKVFKQGLKPW